MKEHKFIFIGGMHRSGTTLLARLMREHVSISGFKDTKAPMDEGQHLQKVYPNPIKYGSVGGFGFNKEAYLDETSNLINQENKQTLFNQWASHWDLSKPFLLEKSPPNIIRTRFLQEMFPETYFIIIKRHPIAVSFATKRFSCQELELDNLFHHWIICHQQLEKDIPYLKYILEVNYEDLVSNPNQVLNQISNFLGISKFEKQLNIRPFTNKKYVNMWNNLPDSIRNQIRDKYGNDIQSLGYNLETFE